MERIEMERVDWVAHECFEQAVIECIAQFFEHRGLRWIESRLNTSLEEVVNSVQSCPTRKYTLGLACMSESGNYR